MNIEKATNSQASTTESENKQTKLRKQPEQEQNHRYGDHLEGYQLGKGMERMEGKVQGLKNITGRYKIDREVKKSTGKGEAKELICTTHGE